MNIRTLFPQFMTMAGRALKGMNTNAAALATHTRCGVWELGPANAPTNVAAGVSQGWQFAIGNLLYAECLLDDSVDTTKDLELIVEWAAVGTEAAKTATWQVIANFVRPNHSIATTDQTYTVVDEAVPPTAGYPTRTTFVIPAADWAQPGVYQVHFRLARVASTSDPVTDPAIHDWTFQQMLVTGAT
jgi:hypothetical protein